MKKRLGLMCLMVVITTIAPEIQASVLSDGDVGDRDQDGMTDVWEQAIVGDNPDDAIATIDDVLRDDDYDNDGFSNIEEFLLGFDPLVPDGNIPDTMNEGLELVAKAFTNAPDRAYFPLIDACFASVLETDPNNYSARVYRAVSRLLNLVNNEDLLDVIEQFGGKLGGNFMVTGDFDFDTAPLIDAVSDVASTNILSAIDASLVDLSAIPTDWTGTVEISTNYFPVDENVYADLGDVMLVKSVLKLFRSTVLMVQAQQLNVDYEKMVIPVDAPHASIVVDGTTNDWAGIPSQLVGGIDSNIDYVKAARNGFSIYFLIAFRDSEYEFMGLETEIMLGRGSEMYVDCYPSWDDTSIWFSATDSTSKDMVWSYANSVLEIEIQVPPGIEVSNACVTDVYVEFGEYVNYGSYGYWDCRDDEELEAPFDTPIETIKGNHPEFMQSIRSAADMERSKTNLQEAIDLFQLADRLIKDRSDSLMHVIEYDPVDEPERVEVLARIEEGEQSLVAPAHIVATNDAGEVSFDETIHLGAFFQPTFLTRAMLPEFWKKGGQPLFDTFPDPTFGGIFPNLSAAKLSAYLSENNVDIDWDDDGVPNGWEYLYYGDPVSDNSDLDDDIARSNDVLRDDDYDNDGFSNIEEFLLGFDPLVPDGNVPDTMGEGLELVAKAFTNDPDRAYFPLIDACFASVLETDPNNYSARVYRAVSRLLNLVNNEDLLDIIEQFGGKLVGNFMVTGDFDFDTAPLIDAVSDVVSTNILSAIDASLVDLSAIPTDWTGTVEISTNYFPVDENVYADLGDVMLVKSVLKLLRSSVLMVRAQQLNVDYEKMVIPVDAPHASIVVDGTTNDWAGIPSQLVGGIDDNIDFVKAARNGSSIYFLIAFRDAEHEFMGLDTEIMLGRDSVMYVECYPSWDYTSIRFSSTDSTSRDMVWSYASSVLEAEIQIPPGIEVSNAYITDMYVEFGEYVNRGGYGYWEYQGDEELESPLDIPIETIKGNHPEFMQEIRSVADMDLSKTNLQEAIDLFQLADRLIKDRSDSLMHIIEYDPVDEPERLEVLARIEEGEQSLVAPAHIVATNDVGEVLFDETIHLGAFFQPAYLTRAMLPEFWKKGEQPLLDTFPDPTFGGIFPDISQAKLSAYLSANGVDIDWDDDGVPNGWECLYYGDPTGGNADSDDDGDGLTTRNEYISGTDPTDAFSSLRTEFDLSNSAQVVIRWQPVEDRIYDIHWSPSLNGNFQLLATGIAYPQNSYTDTVCHASASGFYRVVARMPSTDDLDADGLPDAWEGRYFGNYSANAIDDSDNDGRDNISEYIAGTDPMDSSSFFRVTNVQSVAEGFVLEWVSVPDRTYSIMWAPHLGAAFQTLGDSLVYPDSSFIDTLHNDQPEGFYKVDVKVIK